MNFAQPYSDMTMNDPLYYIQARLNRSAAKGYQLTGREIEVAIERAYMEEPAWMHYDADVLLIETMKRNSL